MEPIVYYAGSPAEPVNVFWTDVDGTTLFDFSSGFTFEAVIAEFGASPAFVKTTGFVGQVGDLLADPPVPNLIITWSITPGDEVASLPTGRYIIRLIATPALGVPLELYGELIVRENAPSRGYCEAADLLLGDLLIPATLNRFDYVNTAADEMNARLGQIYALPLDLRNAAHFVTPMLKKINQFLASGRLIMATGIAGEDMTVNALAAAYIKEAKDDLCAIMDGVVTLQGVPLLTTSLKGASGPFVRNYDATSAVDAFTDFASRGRSLTTWRPGASAAVMPYYSSQAPYFL